MSADEHLPMELWMATPQAVVVRMRVAGDGPAWRDDALVIARRHCQADHPSRGALHDALRAHPRSGAARVLGCIDGVWHDLRGLLQPAGSGAAAPAGTAA